MAIDPGVWQHASPDERRQLMAAEHHERESKAKTWRYSILTVLSIVPFAGVALCLGTVAGETTTINITLIATVALTGVVGLALKVASQRRELVRLRRRITQLEGDLLNVRGLGQ